MVRSRRSRRHWPSSSPSCPSAVADYCTHRPGRGPDSPDNSSVWGCAVKAGRFVGRVGGLAVLLGVGIALGQGVATADATPSAGSSSNSSPSAHHAPRKASAPSRITVRNRISAPVATRPSGVQYAGPLTGKRSSQKTLPSAVTFVDGLGQAVRDLERRLSGISVIGTPMITGSPISQVLSADGTRAVVTTAVYEPGTYRYSSTRVAVIDTGTQNQVGDTLTLPGTGYPPKTVLTADGSRAIVTAPGAGNSTVSVAVIDTATGRQVGDTFTVDGTFVSTVLSAKSSRAVVTTNVYDSPGAYNVSSTRVALIDTATGEQVGDTFTAPGASLSTVLSANGSRAVVTTGVFDPATYLYSASTGVAVLDTATGEQVGDSLSVDGAGFCAVSPDGSRAVLTTSVHNGAGYSPPEVTVIDTASGDQVGDSFFFAGSGSAGVSGSTVFTANGSRAVVAIGSGVAVVDTAAGVQLGDTLTLADTGTEAVSSLMLTEDGSRAVVTARYHSSTSTDGAGWSSRVAVLDTATGDQVGATLTVPGSGYVWGGSARLSKDGARAVIAVGNYDSTGYVTSVVVVDSATGQQVGDVFTVAGQGGIAALSADGSRVLVVTNSHAAVFDTDTGQRVGNMLVGNNLSVAVSADGSRAVITADQSDFLYVTSWVAVIDTATGQQMGATINLPSDSTEFSTVLSADGSRAVVAAYIIGNSHTNDTLRVIVIDTATGQQVGSTLDVAGVRNGYPTVGTDVRVSPDGARVVIQTVAATPPIVAALQGLAGISIFVPILWPVAIPVIFAARIYNSLLSKELWTVIDTETGRRVGTRTVSGLDGRYLGSEPSPIFLAGGTRLQVVSATDWQLSNLGRASTAVSTVRIG